MDVADYEWSRITDQYGSLLQMITDLKGQDIDDDLPGPVVSALDDVLERIQLQICHEWTCETTQ